MSSRAKIADFVGYTLSTGNEEKHILGNSLVHPGEGCSNLLPLEPRSTHVQTDAGECRIIADN